MAGPSGESRGEKPFLGVVPESSEKKKKNEEMKNRKKKRRLKRTVESLIPPHVVPWLVDIWIGTGCSKTKMHLTAFCNVWAGQPTCMQFSEESVMGVEEPREFEKTEEAREKLKKRMWTGARVLKTCKARKG